MAGASKKMNKAAIVELEIADILDTKLIKGAKGVTLQHDFVVYMNDSNRPMIFELDDVNQAKMVTPEQVAGKLLPFFDNLKKSRPDLFLEFDRYVKIVRSWSYMTDNRIAEMPKVVAFKNDPSICYQRLDFEPVRGGGFLLQDKAPIFANILARMTNAEAFAARFGSLFFETCNRKQAVWLYGPPNCGKSTVADMIVELVGPRVCTAVEAPDGRRSSHFNEIFVGKKLAIFNEANPNFLKTNLFKSLTGDTYHVINPKNQPQFTARLEVVLMFISNNEPVVHSDPAAQNRIIACEMTPFEGPPLDPQTLGQKLAKERPWVVGHCMDAYEMYSERGGFIPSDQRRINDLTFFHEHEFLEFLDTYIQKSGVDDYVRARDLREFFRENGMHDNRVYGKLINIIGRIYNGRRGQKVIDGQKVAVIWGISVKPGASGKRGFPAYLTVFKGGMDD